MLKRTMLYLSAALALCCSMAFAGERVLTLPEGQALVVVDLRDIAVPVRPTCYSLDQYAQTLEARSMKHSNIERPKRPDMRIASAGLMFDRAGAGRERQIPRPALTS